MCFSTASAFDLKGLLNNAGNTDASDVVNGLVNAVTSTSVEYKDLPGTWRYNKPAVTFKSDNMLKNAGGAAASATIVNKLKPYYATAGLNNMTVKFAADSTFEIKTGKINVNGTVQSLGKGMFKFNIKALGAIPSGSINAYIERQGKNIAITFDAKKLIKLAETLASLSGNATIKTVTDMINSYEGINIGFDLKK